ncbi:hypothetical protein CNR22_12030 [Sphingobacteriaceae bacterium]|nr:hypothetical protein CNR22_12030 [Sphingobacteriaceae bacterium]
MAKVLYKKNWDFILYELNSKLIIEVVFFGLVDYSRSFILIPEEITEDFDSLKNLSEKIRNNYEFYNVREVDTPVASA